LGVQESDVAAVEELLGELLRRLDPTAVPLPLAPGVFGAFEKVNRLSASGMTLMARRVDESRAWKRDGYRSAAEQLAGVAGTSVSAARNMLETSKQVEGLPATAAALRGGKLSPAKAAAIASAATVAPEAEADLLDGADAPYAVVRDKCLQAKAVDRDAAHARIRRERYAREFPDQEGAWNFVARGTPEAGAAFRVGFDPIVDEMFKAARAEGREEPREAYAFDALIEMARRASGAGDGDCEASTSRKKASPRFMALLRIDHASLRRGTVEGDEICEIAGLGPIPVSVARDLLGDAVLKLVITKGVDVANVTHLGRSPTVAQQVALWWLSPMCTNEDCTRTWRLENDHRIGWKETQRTRLDEIDPLCEHEHDLKTYFGWSLVPGKGRRAFVPPDDPRHPKNHPPPDPLVFCPGTLVTRLMGGPPMAVWCR
jgi:hypothetical protein